MNELREALVEYLALRRSLGFKLQAAESALRQFVTFAENEGAAFVTTDLVLRWAMQQRTIQPATRAAHVSMVRQFAVWRSATDSRTEVPPEGLLACRYERKNPYIFSDEEISRILVATERLPSRRGLRGPTYATCFGLLAVTGMRVSEAVALDRRDVDLSTGILTIRQTKFGKSRLVPLHPSARDALGNYAEKRDNTIAPAATPGFFVSERGARITRWGVGYNFAKVSSRVGLRPPFRGHRYGRGPRLHDLRHRFAVRTLTDWYRTGVDVEREMPKLAAYLGHTHINDTYWYIEAIPELLQLATQRLMSRGKGVAQ